MRKQRLLNDISSQLAQCARMESVKGAVEDALRAGAEPLEVVDAVSEGLDEVGRLYDEREVFLMELVLVGDTASEIMSILEPLFKTGAPPARGRVVIGTVRGDLHYIGKDIVTVMLRSKGFGVVDLGVDVSADRFVSAVREEQPAVLGMSGLLTTVVDSMRETMDALRASGLRGRTKVMIGGRAASEDVAEMIGADAFGANAVDAVELATRFAWSEGEVAPVDEG
ncbi:MAG: cobalamin-dependent protein [Anaerolineae bacterium]